MPAGGLPSRAGHRWDHAEDTRLLYAFDQGLSIDALARHHGRTEAGIRARLIRHGRIEAGPEDSSAVRAAAGAVPPATSAAGSAATQTVTMHFLPEEIRHVLRALQFEEARLGDLLRMGDVNSAVLRKVQEAEAAVQQLVARFTGRLPR